MSSIERPSWLGSCTPSRDRDRWAKHLGGPEAPFRSFDRGLVMKSCSLTLRGMQHASDQEGCMDDRAPQDHAWLEPMPMQLYLTSVEVVLSQRSESGQSTGVPGQHGLQSNSSSVSSLGSRLSCSRLPSRAEPPRRPGARHGSGARAGAWDLRCPGLGVMDPECKRFD